MECGNLSPHSIPTNLILLQNPLHSLVVKIPVRVSRHRAQVGQDLQIRVGPRFGQIGNGALDLGRVDTAEHAMPTTRVIQVNHDNVLVSRIILPPSQDNRQKDKHILLS